MERLIFFIHTKRAQTEWGKRACLLARRLPSSSFFRGQGHPNDPVPVDSLNPHSLAADARLHRRGQSGESSGIRRLPLHHFRASRHRENARNSPAITLLARIVFVFVFVLILQCLTTNTRTTFSAEVTRSRDSGRMDFSEFI